MNENVVLVTGGAGYIGSHACKELSRKGYVPVTYDNLVYGHEWAVKWGPLEIGDIADRRRLDEVIRKHRPSAVMHFAAYAYVGESVAQPLKYYHNNVAGSLALLEAMRDHGIERIIFSSSCATYGVPDVIPISEDRPQQPVNPYGASKLMVERMLADAAQPLGISSTSLRYFNAAGADPDTETGEDHSPETHLIPLVLDAAAGRRSSVTIFGTDYDTPDGTCIRDYVHVTDLAAAHILALGDLERLAREGSGPVCKAFNLGNGQGFSVREVVDAVEKITGRTVPVEMGERRQGDPPVLVGDAGKIRDELGWQPKYADLDQIIETAWRWHESHFQPLTL